ncbi:MULTISPECIES: ABC-three component system middle component 1 [Halomonadaceae]|uniref:Uncharacterized protein n=1 Tax=Vreelandella glaciei TaxID=186761 RepID=A0A7Z0LSM7_9GAMM|nr:MULTISPECIES: ABC-three component system middle component 1 [Halomonas]NYS77839.1 hypothetical protein [Halomonas glaciei]|tara:strand:+ start:2492 stop:3031 length:540 start_codon:yes stop_codon:yes gene_type:complete
MKLLTKEVDLGLLSTQFENIQFHMFCSDDRLSFISCMVCVCETKEEIINNWRTIQNIMTVYHQSSGGFDAWNMYLAFFSVEYLPVWDKYEIENNKFSARKIVLDGLQKIPSIDQMIIELEKQLLGSDLTLETRSDHVTKDLTNLENYYRGAPLDSRSASREKRALMIDKIIESLSSNEN